MMSMLLSVKLHLFSLGRLSLVAAASFVLVACGESGSESTSTSSNVENSMEATSSPTEAVEETEDELICLLYTSDAADE